MLPRESSVLLDLERGGQAKGGLMGGGGGGGAYGGYFHYSHTNKHHTRLWTKSYMDLGNAEIVSRLCVHSAEANKAT